MTDFSDYVIIFEYVCRARDLTTAFRNQNIPVVSFHSDAINNARHIPIHLSRPHAFTVVGGEYIVDITAVQFGDHFLSHRSPVFQLLQEQGYFPITGEYLYDYFNMLTRDDAGYQYDPMSREELFKKVTPLY